MSISRKEIRNNSNLWTAEPKVKPAKSTSNNLDDGLCVRCSSLDLDDLYLQTTRSSQEYTYGSGRLGTAVQLGLLSPECRLCRVFIHCAKPHNFGREMYQIRKVPVGRVLDMNYIEHSNHKPLKNMLAVYRCPSNGIKPYKKAQFFFDRGFVLQYKHSSPDTGAHTSLESIDFRTLHTWLEDCKQTHVSCRKVSAPGFDVPVFVVDCKSLKIIEWKAEMQFTALSYVWGPQSTALRKEQEFSPDLDSSGMLSMNAPAVIRDAIKVTKSLGLQYLWVDRYCISETNPQVKHLQIQSMDKIYSQAYFTIISLGDDPTKGLPGVSIPRLRPREYVGSYCFTVTLRDPVLEVFRSVWNTRGWTFQEAFLSQRKLFFTSDQVIFECCTLLHLEAKELHAGVSPENIPIVMEINRVPRHTINPIITTHDLCGYISCYNQRKLRYDSDALNAFLGIFNGVNEEPRAIKQYWGLPILPKTTTNDTLNPPQTEDLESSLHDDSLLITTRFSDAITFDIDYGIARRRHKFPSWSWTGWHKTDFRPRDARSSIKDVSIDIELVNGEICNLEAFYSSGGFDLPISKLSTFIHIETRTTPVRLFKINQHRCKRAEFRTRTGMPWYSDNAYVSDNVFSPKGATMINDCIGTLIHGKVLQADTGLWERVILLAQETGAILKESVLLSCYLTSWYKASNGPDEKFDLVDKRTEIEKSLPGTN